MNRPESDNRIKTLERMLREGDELSRIFFEREKVNLLEIARLISDKLRDGGKLLTFGNGGSAADAEHFAAEMVNRFERERPALPAMSLNTAPSVLTSIANDRDFSLVFSRQIEALGNKGDVAFAISTSGESPNAVEAVKKAAELDILTVGLLGGDGGELLKYCEMKLVVPGDSTPRIQEVHIKAVHILCHFIEEFYFDKVDQ